MNKIFIDNKFKDNEITISTNSFIVLNEDVQADKIKYNIINCDVYINDFSCVQEKVFNLENSKVTIVDTINSSRNSCIINNDSSIVEYDIIDLIDENVNYYIEENSISEQGITSINIASVSYKKCHKDFSINTFNLKPYTQNNINCFGIVKDDSILKYDVRSFIKNGATKSVVKQDSKILLLDKQSIGINNPILEIDENDVKASHGSSIGKIDDDTLFYMCSRGLNKDEAINLICLGKVQYLISKIENEKYREALNTKFRERMS